MAKMDTSLIESGLVAEGDIELLELLCETLARNNVSHIKVPGRLELRIEATRRTVAPEFPAATPDPPDHDLYAATGMVPLDLRKVRGQ